MTVTAASEIRLVNNIALHFRYLPADKAAAAIADHVNRFWDPRMKTRLIELVAGGAGGLDPLAAAATPLLR